MKADERPDAPLFSIIVATYNAAATLPAALDSVIDQDRADTELIVIDGASRDDTKEIIAARAGSIAFWCSEPDTGIYNAWNKGLRASRGRYIGFLGADDQLLPGSLAQYAALVAAHPHAEYLSARVRYGPGGRIIGKRWDWRRFRRYMTVAHLCSMHRRSLFDRIGPYDESFRIVGDYELLLRAGPTLAAAFSPAITAEMGTEGISSGATGRVFAETARAKRMHSGLSPMTIRFDELTARAKHRVRRLLKL